MNKVTVLGSVTNSPAEKMRLATEAGAIEALRTDFERDEAGYISKITESYVDFMVVSTFIRDSAHTLLRINVEVQ